MSIFNYEQESTVDICPRRVKARELRVWNETTQEYELISPGGDVELPYWVKPNSAQLSNEQGNTTYVKPEYIMNSDGVTTSYILPGKFSINSIESGTAVLDKPKIDLLENLKNAVDWGAPPTPTPGYTHAISWDPETQKLTKGEGFEIKWGSNGARYDHNGIALESAFTKSNLTSSGVNFLTGTTKRASLGVDATFKPILTLGDATSSHDLTKEDIQVTNNLRAAVDAATTAPVVLNASSHAVGWNPITKSFTKNAAVQVNTSTNSSTLGPNWVRVYNTSNLGTELNPSELKFGISGSTRLMLKSAQTNAGSYLRWWDTPSVFRDFTYDDIGVTNSLKTLTDATPDANSRMMIYNPTNKEFGYSAVPSARSQQFVTWKASTATLPWVAASEWNSTTKNLKYGTRSLVRFSELTHIGDTLWIDFSEYGSGGAMSSGSKYYFPIAFQGLGLRSGGGYTYDQVWLDVKYSDANITASIYRGSITAGFANPINFPCWIVELHATSSTTAVGSLKIKVAETMTPVYNSISTVTPTFLPNP